MQEIGIRELKQRASEVLRQVAEGREPVAITRRGKVIARIVPVEDDAEALARDIKVLAQMDELAEEISKLWSPKDTSAVDAVREQRRRSWD